MRVLVVTPEAPAPRHVNGGATRQYRLYRRLIRFGHAVTLAAAFPPTDEPYEEQLREEGFEVVASRRPASRPVEVMRAVLRKPGVLLGVTRLSLKELIASIIWVDLAPRTRRLLSEREFDVVVIESESARAWIRDLEFDAPGLLTIYEFESAQFLEKSSRVGGFSGWLRERNGRRALASERKWIPRYDGVIMMSDEEIELLAAAVPDHPPAFAVGNGADPAAFELSMPSPGHQRVLFAGTMLFPPNRSAAEWLAREVWPRVRERAPAASLEIVGRSPSAHTRALGELPGVTVTADAPTMAPHLAAADVCAIPMLEGGGTRLKLADAMAAGRAIVSTTNGACGIDVRDRRDVLIADDPESFASAIIDLLEDADLRERLGTAARARAAAEYDWDRLGDRLAEVLSSTAAGLVAVPRNPLLTAGV